MTGFSNSRGMQLTICALSVLAVLGALKGSFAMDNAPVEYLSDILDQRLMYLTQGWGELGIDTAAHAPGITPLPIQIADKRFAKGLGHHANGEIAIALDGEFSTFECEVGVLKQGQNIGTVVFQVFVDGQKRFDSGVMHEKDAAKPVKVSVERAQMLRLVAGDAGDGITCDCACWAEARLTRNPNAKAIQAEAVDVAPFGRVVTFDPHRMDGAHSNRTEEFRQEDVYLATDLKPAADGTYTVPTVADGMGCIGLQWYERRVLRSVGLQLAGRASLPEGTRAQVWVGESWWQGEWQDLESAPLKDGAVWRWEVAKKGNLQLRARGLQKVRWLFPKTAQPVVVARLSARTRSAWDTVALRLEGGASGSAQAQVEVYNGEFLDGTAGERLQTWDMRQPLRVKVRSCRPGPIKADQTVLRFRVSGLPGGASEAFAVAIDDVLEKGCVWVPDAGVYVTRDPGGPSLQAYLAEIAGKKTVRQRVREMPDQTFEQAWAKVHDPVQDFGPVLLSLARDNWKYQVEREGAILFSIVPDNADWGWGPQRAELRLRFGSGKADKLTRHLDGEWMPIPVTAVTDGGIVYSQRTFVAPFGPEGKPVCVVEYRAENPTGKDAAASWAIAVTADISQNLPARIDSAPGGFAACKGERVLAYLKTASAGGLKASVDGATVNLSTALKPGKAVHFAAYLPSWETNPGGCDALPGGQDLLAATKTYWERQLAGTMQINIPDCFLANAIRASQVHCLLAARNEANGDRVSAWISSDRYGPLESEAHSVILGMDDFGHHDFARRSLDYFICRYNAAGYLTTGYTVMGTGWHLWTLARHFGLTGDADWMRSVAPKVEKACVWIERQREKTLETDPDGPDAAQRGIMPPGVVADWGLYGNRYYMDVNYFAGLTEASAALKAVGQPGADKLAQDAADFGEALRRSYGWTQARMPVRPLQDGTWIPAPAGMANCFGPVGEFFTGEDGSRSWATDSEIGPHHLVALGAIDPHSKDADQAMDDLEDHWCLETGMGDYPADKNHKDWFDLGGFAKIQPYYGRMPQVYALRDEVKPFVRSYFNAIPSLLGSEVLSFWEHFHNTGGWNKTHETGSFLQQTRTMFVMERGKELWLAPFVTNQWMGDGMTVEISNAPTTFGEVSYRIRSFANQGFIEAHVHAPSRQTPEAIVVRLRHPEGKRMQSATVNGKPWTDFDPAREIVRVGGVGGDITVRANY